MRFKPLAAGLAIAASCWAQQPQLQSPDPMDLLAKVRQKVTDSVSRIPRYLCTETVERKRFELPSETRSGASCSEIAAAFQKYSKRLQLSSADRLRLDVAVVGNREIYSWVGEGRFGDQSLGEMVNQGLTANGAFGTFLSSIFGTPAATFSYLRESRINDRQVLEYVFRVPLSKSEYGISDRKNGANVGYSGNFSVDEQTLNLLRLEIDADDIPSVMNFCQISNQMDYSSLRMSNIDFLLPSEASTRVINKEGSLSVNRTSFSGCHQFLGEAKLVFDDTPASIGSPAPVQAGYTEIPQGLAFEISLAQAIDPAVAAAGEPIRGILSKSVEIPGSKVMIPQGAIVHGRICAMEVNYGRFNSVEFALKWETIDFAGVSQAIRFSFDSPVSGTAKTVEVFPRLAPFRFGSTLDETIGYLSFADLKKNYKIPAGFKTTWLSLPPKLANRTK